MSMPLRSQKRESKSQKGDFKLIKQSLRVMDQKNEIKKLKEELRVLNDDLESRAVLLLETQNKAVFLEEKLKQGGG